MIALRDDAAVVSADCAVSAEPVVVSAEVSVLSDAAASDCVSAESGLGGLCIPEGHGPAARNVHSRYRRNAEKTDQQQYSDKGNYTLFQ